ncbi:MAG: peroxiredoxin [Burkholderiaceae bacterium]
MSIAVGKKIPDFKAESTGGEFALKAHRGRKLVIYFYPKDNTPGCTTESQDFTAKFKQFAKAECDIVGVSRDKIKSHQNFKAKHDFPFELIADPEETVCELFGVMKMKNMYGKQVRGIERSTFLIGTDGKLLEEWRGVKVPGHVDAVLEAVKAA